MALFWRLVLFLTLTTVGSGLRVSVNPLKARMKAGSNVLLSCLFDTGESVIDLTHLSVTWTLQGHHSVAEFQYGEINTWKGVRLFKDELINGNASVLIRKLAKTDMGTYRCEVEYSSEAAHQQMNLQIYEKELQVNASSSKVQVNKGDKAVLNCTFTIDGPHVDQDHLEVRWLLNGTQVISFNKIERSTRENAYLFGVMKSDVSLVLPEVKIEEEGNYTCYVKYTPEEASQSIYLKVTGSGLKVNVYPLKARERSGSDVVLNCTFSTDDSHINLEMLNVKWISNGSNIAAQYSSHQQVSSQRVKIVKDELHNGKAALLLSNVTKTDAGSYKCEVEYKLEKADQQMNLEIQEKELQVYVASSIVRVNKRSRAVLNCTFTTGEYIDLDHLYVQWLLNESEVLSFSRIQRPTRKGARLSAVGKGDVSLILPDVKNDEKGKYICRVWYTPDLKEEFIDLEVTDLETEGEATGTSMMVRPTAAVYETESVNMPGSKDYTLWITLPTLIVAIAVIISLFVYIRKRQSHNVS